MPSSNFFLFLLPNSFVRHNEKSDLHRSNLESWRREHAKSGSSQTASTASGGSAGASREAIGGDGMIGGHYRDRAQERRQKYGIDDEGPRPNRLKEKYLAAMEEAEFSNSVKEPKKLDSSNNIGSKMLERMGWKEGLGLGKANQGRTNIIEVSNSSLVCHSEHLLFEKQASWVLKSKMLGQNQHIHRKRYGTL